MSIQRIDHDACRSYGYQARWPNPMNTGTRWTRFFSDAAHGGREQAYRLAQIEEQHMRRTAARTREARKLDERKVAPA